MTKLLIKLFVKDKDNVTDPAVRGRYAALAGITGILLNLLLFAGKLTAGLLAASVAVIADAFNNVSDAGSSVVTLIGFRLASKPVDKEHPLGHGRLEYITGFIVDMLIILVGAELFKSSIEKIASPRLPSVTTLTLVLLGAAILVKLWLFFFYRKIGRLIDSSAIKATSFDSISDVVATTLVLVSALVAKFAGLAIDGWAGILVACFILFTGLKAAKETIDLLLGTPPSSEFIKAVYDFVKGYPEVAGIHDVIVHDYGPRAEIYFLSCGSARKQRHQLRARRYRLHRTGHERKIRLRRHHSSRSHRHGRSRGWTKCVFWQKKRPRTKTPPLPFTISA